MGHHLTADGQFKSDRHPDLPAGKIVLSFKDPHAHLGLWTVAIEYQKDDPELSADMMAALDALGAVPSRAVVEDAWAWSLARREGVDPRATARVFGGVCADGSAEVHVVSADVEAIVALRGAIGAPSVHIYEHLVRPRQPSQPPPRATARPVESFATVAVHEGSPADDGRPDFAGFLAALRGEKQWSATIHATDDTGQAATDQRRLHELAEHVERVGRALGFLAAAPAPAGPTLRAMQDNDAPLLAKDDRWGSCP